MTSDLKIMTGLLAAALTLLVGLQIRPDVDEYPVNLLILTRDGYNYEQFIGLKTEEDKAHCVTLAH